MNATDRYKYATFPKKSDAVELKMIGRRLKQKKRGHGIGRRVTNPALASSNPPPAEKIIPQAVTKKGYGKPDLYRFLFRMMMDEEKTIQMPVLMVPAIRRPFGDCFPELANVAPTFFCIFASTSRWEIVTALFRSSGL